MEIEINRGLDELMFEHLDIRPSNRAARVREARLEARDREFEDLLGRVVENRPTDNAPPESAAEREARDREFERLLDLCTDDDPTDNTPDNAPSAEESSAMDEDTTMDQGDSLDDDPAANSDDIAVDDDISDISDWDMPPPRQYSGRFRGEMPKLPRVDGVAGNATHNAWKKWKFAKRGIADTQKSGFSNIDFLAEARPGNFKWVGHVHDWTYDERRRAQEVLPHLFLGPVQAARDKEWLKKEGITMVMAVRDTLSAEARILTPKAPHDLGLQVSYIDVLGNPQLIAAFPRAIDQINAHMNSRYLQQQRESEENQHESKGKEKFCEKKATVDYKPPGKVLIFCETGVERSATMAAAYIMAMYSIDQDEALHIMSMRRFCLHIDDKFRYLLQSWQYIIEAKRDVFCRDEPQSGEPPESKTSRRGEKRRAESAPEDSDEGRMDVDRGSEGPSGRPRHEIRPDPFGI